jgi:alkyl sulfatase BDS1-like metallo-beta-lactamase superfamily hydrolase
MAALKARTLCPGHGGPVVNDPEKIERMLLETADYLEDIVGQTLAALEEGGPPHVDILQRVVPQTRDSPWLQPIYDEPEFIIRNTIRKYAGWWSGRPSELKPAARQALAKEIVALAGGASILNRRAKELAAAGEMRVACHLADFALEAAPEDKESQEVAAEIYELRAGSEVSLMASNLFRLAAAYAREGRPFV